MFSRIIWVVVWSGLFSITLYGFFLYEIDLVTSGNNDEDIQFMMALITVNHTDGTILPDVHELKELGLYPSNSTIDSFRAGLFDGTNSTKDRITELVSDDNIWHTLSLLVGVTIHEFNEDTGAWGSHFLTVLMIEEIEALGLLLFYRKFYFKRVGVSWQSIGLPKKTKKFVRWYNKKPHNKSEVY